MRTHRGIASAPATAGRSTSLSYVDPEWRGRGVGGALYGELVPTLRRQRFVNAYAGIGLPNDASVAIHESMGMSLIGVYEKVGWKLGQWVDVAWYGMRLTDASGRRRTATSRAHRLSGLDAALSPVARPDTAAVRDWPFQGLYRSTGRLARPRGLQQAC